MPQDNSSAKKFSDKYYDFLRDYSGDSSQFGAEASQQDWGEFPVLSKEEAMAAHLEKRKQALLAKYGKK